jgi:hypothetical protein
MESNAALSRACDNLDVVDLICRNAEIRENRRFEESVVSNFVNGLRNPSFNEQIYHLERVVAIHRAWPITTPSKRDPTRSVSEQVITEHLNKILELRAMEQQMWARLNQDDELDGGGVWQVMSVP